MEASLGVVGELGEIHLFSAHGSGLNRFDALVWSASRVLRVFGASLSRHGIWQHVGRGWISWTMGELGKKDNCWADVSSLKWLEGSGGPQRGKLSLNTAALSLWV